MKAAYYTGKEKFEIRDIVPPKPGPGEVAVKVAYCGICGTDLHIFHGKMDARVNPPGIIGHEMSGTVAELGEGVTGWKVGDKVVVRPLDWCGECPACRAGHSHICMKLKFMGIDSIGALQERWNVKARTLYKVPEGLSLRTAALIEPLAVACHDVRIAELKKDEFALVMGGGPIGILIALVARAAGARVLISEINPYRIDFARKAGFEVINPQEKDLAEAVNAATGGAGADVVFEVTASEYGAGIMTELARTRGRIVAVGIYSQPPKVNLHRFFWRELRLFGARLYEAEDYEKGLALAATLGLEPLITAVFDLDDIQKAYESLNGNATTMKTMIKCS